MGSSSPIFGVKIKNTWVATSQYTVPGNSASNLFGIGEFTCHFRRFEIVTLHIPPLARRVDHSLEEKTPQQKQQFAPEKWMLGRWCLSYFQGPTVKLPGSVPYVTLPQPVVSRKCLHSHEIWQVDFSPKWSRHWFFFQRNELQTFQPGPSNFWYTTENWTWKIPPLFQPGKSPSKASGFLGFKMLNFCGKNKLLDRTWCRHLSTEDFPKKYHDDLPLVAPTSLGTQQCHRMFHIYCWWFRNPKANDLGCIKNCK